MHEDDEFTDEESYTIETLPAARVNPIDLVILVVDTLAYVARTPARFLGELTDLLCRHANWQVQQRVFARQVSEEIERIVSGE